MDDLVLFQVTGYTDTDAIPRHVIAPDGPTGLQTFLDLYPDEQFHSCMVEQLAPVQCIVPSEGIRIQITSDTYKSP